MIEKAFPSIAFDSIGQITSLDEGMDLRDYFAAKAMQSIIIYDKGDFHLPSIAKESYRMADEMMEARK